MYIKEIERYKTCINFNENIVFVIHGKISYNVSSNKKKLSVLALEVMFLYSNLLTDIFLIF